MTHMTMRRACATLAALTALPLATAADQPAARRVSLTIYSDGSALVGDTRTMALTSGEQDVQWPDIPATVDAPSVHLSAPSTARILLQTYRYDFAEAGRALELARGRRVACTTEDGKRIEGTLWAMDGGTLTLATDGGLLLLQQPHLISVETPAPSRPLTPRPTLAWRLWSGKGGSSDVTASYLARGLNWGAEYTLLVSDDDRRGILSGAASISNTTGSDFRDASVRLVAGSPRRIRPPHEPILMMSMKEGRAADGAAAPEMAVEETVDDYHLYTITRRVTVADKETQRVALFDDAQVKPRRTYRYAPGRGRYGSTGGISTELALTNDEKSGLGMPIPGGRVRVYTETNGGEVLLGEDQIGHVARGDTLRLVVGSPFDLTARREQANQRRISDREQEQTWSTTFRNSRANDATIVWDETIPGTTWRILESSQEYAKKDANTIRFSVRVPAGKEVAVSYTARWSY
jgi:hypothetical protein